MTSFSKYLREAFDRTTPSDIDAVIFSAIEKKRSFRRYVSAAVGLAAMLLLTFSFFSIPKNVFEGEKVRFDVQEEGEFALLLIGLSSGCDFYSFPISQSYDSYPEILLDFQRTIW